MCPKMCSKLLRYIRKIPAVQYDPTCGITIYIIPYVITYVALLYALTRVALL